DVLTTARRTGALWAGVRIVGIRAGRGIERALRRADGVPRALAATRARRAPDVVRRAGGVEAHARALAGPVAAVARTRRVDELCDRGSAPADQLHAVARAGRCARRIAAAALRGHAAGDDGVERREAPVGRVVRDREDLSLLRQVVERR